MAVKQKSILYLTYNYNNKSQAQYLNSTLRVKVLKKLGYKVVLFNINQTLSEWITLLKVVKKIDYLFIRIDGSGILDKYSLLKLFNPQSKLIWEVHGCQEEKLLHLRSRFLSTQLIINKIRRKTLSLFVNAYVFVSKELQNYCYESKTLAIKTHFIIPNFIDPHFLKKVNINNKTLKILNPKLFKVLWIGNPFFKWHGLDIIEAVAKKIYSIDKQITFVITGDNSWHNFTWQKNIILVNSLNPKSLNSYITISDICLAIYKKNPHFPRYFFPLKILNYLSFKKPVIASNTKTIKQLITNNQTGLLTNNSTNDITRKILKLKNSSSFRKKLSANAYKSLNKNYSQNQALTQCKEVFAILQK